MKLRVDRTTQAFLLLSLPGLLLLACAVQAVDSGPPGGGSSGGTGGSVSSGGVSGSISAGGVAGSIAAGGVAGSIAAGGVAGSIAAGGVAGSIAAGGVAGSISAGGVAGSIASGGVAGSIAAGGVAGSIASGGVAGTAGSSGSAGTAGSSGSSGSGGQTGTCSGCARLSVPIAADGDSANFRIDLASTVDMSSATITFRLCVSAGTGGILQAYVQHSGTPDYAQLFQGWQVLTGIMNFTAGFQNVAFNVGTTAGTFDKTVVGRIGIQVGDGNSTSWTNPTVVHIDSITVSGAAIGPYNFESASTIAAMAGASGVMGLSNDTSPAGSAITWLN
jgi:hypothetical protein